MLAGKASKHNVLRATAKNELLRVGHSEAVQQGSATVSQNSEAESSAL